MAGMNSLQSAERSRGSGRRLRHLGLFGCILAVQFGIFEIALRVWGSSEAAPAFQGLFEGDPGVGYRLKPGARVRYTTAEFETDIAINGAGVRDDEELGPKQADEKRIVVLGDSLVMSVQVPLRQTFTELLEKRLNAASNGIRYRVVNAGVQGYGPVEQALYFQSIGAILQPDLVIATVFVGNDAEEAFRSAFRFGGERAGGIAAARETLHSHLRRLVRRSMVLQVFRLRANTVFGRLGFSLTPPEPPLQSYAANPAPRIEEGLGVARRAVELVVETASRLNARTAIVLMPARFQLDDPDYGRLKAIVAETGGELIRDAATRRFEAALESVPVPRLDLLPALRATLPGPDLFFQTNVHLTPHGHEVVADALAEFIRQHGLLGPDRDR
jgi:lysophospholipase L1-like esterase